MAGTGMPYCSLWRSALIVLALMLMGCGPSQAHEAAPHPGIDVLHYTFRLTLDDASDRIQGEATVRLRLQSDTLTAARLDLIGVDGGTGMRVTSVAEGGTPVAFSQSNNHVHIALASASAGAEHTFVVAYEGVPADGLIIGANQHGDRTFFGDNWPNRARHWLPTVDHPRDKATVEWIVTAPARYEVVANGALVEDAALADDQRRTHWRADEPLPTKVMVIGVADFAVQDVGVYDDTPIQSWVYPEDTTRGFRDLGQADRILRFFETQLGNYPYAKLANVQSTTRYGGMENASAIFYSESAVADRQNDEPLLAHEIAHQWYGNAVTETDWPHLWLSEGFATYLTQLYLEATYGRERRRIGMANARRRVVRFAEANPTEPLVDTTYTDPTELLNTNPYQKGAWVLHMLRHQVGDSTFWDGLRQYYTTYRHQNASTNDFQQVMEDASGQSLGWFFDQWTRRPGQPHVEGTWQHDEAAGTVTVSLEQTQEAPPFRLRLEVGLYPDTRSQPILRTLEMDGRTRTATFSLEAAGTLTDVQLDPHAWTLMTSTFERE
jgi:aminopeptidase N